MGAIDWDGFTGEVLLLYAASREAKTTQRMRQVLRRARTVAPTPADLTPAAVAAFAVAVKQGRHANTAATKLSYLRRACSYAVSRGYLAANPFTAWSGFVRWAPPGPIKVHPPGSIGRVLAALAARAAESPADARLHAWAALLAHTGLRRDESLFLRAEDLDLEGATVTVRRRLKRPTTARTVPLAAGLPAILGLWLPQRADGAAWVFPNRRGNPWSGGSPGYRPIDKLRDAAEAVGVKGFTPKSLRSSFATLAATTWAIPPATLQRWMGHTDIRTTMRYYVHLDLAALRTAALAVSFPAA